MPELEHERRDRTLVLYLNRPPANTLTEALLSELCDRLDEASDDDSVRAVVLASRIPKYFSSGLEPTQVWTEAAGPREEAFRALIRAHRELSAFPKPTLAAVEGSALLGGFILALGCDYRLLGEEGGRVSLSEVRLGLSPTTPLIRLVSRLGVQQAVIKELVLEGRTLRAKEAFDAGLADGVVSPGSGVLELCLEEAARLSKLPPKAFAAVKRAYREALCPDRLWPEALVEFRDLLGGGEAAEGLAAVAQKRRPRWE